MVHYLNVAICDVCWKKENGDRQPHRLVNPEKETCASCGRETTSGIYVRKEERREHEDR
jgi:hypothetical protein